MHLACSINSQPCAEYNHYNNDFNVPISCSYQLNEPIYYSTSCLSAYHHQYQYQSYPIVKLTNQLSSISSSPSESAYSLSPSTSITNEAETSMIPECGINMKSRLFNDPYASADINNKHNRSDSKKSEETRKVPKKIKLELLKIPRITVSEQGGFQDSDDFYAENLYLVNLMTSFS